MSQWWVVCLCAEWCGTCREYRAVFHALARQYPRLRFEWLDIEDESDIVDELDVQTFPTLLIADGAQVRFLGPLTPPAEVLARLIERLQAQPAPEAPADALGQQIFERLRQARA
ncbi:thioredoxin family protein [Ramlibacter sp. H39-3-26]|uniref:thioredoxin family protein n=1 Tax=Curvibacter soli TaxID=3031331 RepID=UPI0023DB3273|nr:thioredoxin family protein [Ramlibacter sp. H39-3-26]MDF1486589.1 thioredoxin family protein [Ramlibacter sp. H39-3-26]